MRTLRHLKTALFAAASVGAAAAVMPDDAHAADVDATIAGAAVEMTADATLAAPAQNETIPHKWLLAALATGALAGLTRLLAGTRLGDMVAEAAPKVGAAARNAAGAAVRASADAAKAVGRSVSSPLRFALAVAALGVFALVGLGVYDVEWLGGLVAGGALGVAGVVAAGRMRAAASLQAVRARFSKKDGAPR
ncbi:MAG: hypothetical protein AAGC56_00925 [Pseudomonadota bacterium]